jgi:hypothetical protein
MPILYQKAIANNCHNRYFMNCPFESGFRVVANVVAHTISTLYPFQLKLNINLSNV